MLGIPYGKIYCTYKQQLCEGLGNALDNTRHFYLKEQLNFLTHSFEIFFELAEACSEEIIKKLDTIHCRKFQEKIDNIKKLKKEMDNLEATEMGIIPCVMEPDCQETLTRINTCYNIEKDLQAFIKQYATAS